MVTIIFESHGTTVDNEKHLASGWADVELSERGVKESKDLGERYKNEHFDAIFCSDLQRSYKSAEIAFGDKFKIVKSPLLKECDYGDLTQHPSEEVDKEKPKRINMQFPSGESYDQTSERMRVLLQELLKGYDGKRVMIIGHRATQYGLERWCNGVPVSVSVQMAPDWHWQPGWEYKLTDKWFDLLKE